MKWRFFILLGLLPLGGCFDDQRASLAKCEIATPGDPNLFFSDYSRQMYLCMEAAGYEMDLSSDLCQPNINLALWVNPYCYSPTGKLQKEVHKVEMSLFYSKK